MVLASGRVHQEIGRIVADMDVEGSTLQLRYYGVKNAEVSVLADTLGRLFKIEVGTDIRSARGRRRGRGAQAAEEEPAIIPDFNLGAILVLAGKAVHERVAKALEKLDAAGPGGR